MIIVKYETEEEAQQIIQEQTGKGLLLVEVMNITEGNFLGFSDNPNPTKTPIEQQLDDLKAENTALQQQLAQSNADFTAFTDFYFEKNPAQA